MACSNVDSPTPPTRGKGWAAACAREANGRLTATLDGPTGWRREGYQCIGYCFIKYGICSRTSHATTTRSRRTSSSLAGIVHTWKGAVHRPGVATWQHAATRLAPRAAIMAMHFIGSQEARCRARARARAGPIRRLAIGQPGGSRLRRQRATVHRPPWLGFPTAAGWVTTRAPLKTSDQSRCRDPRADLTTATAPPPFRS